MKKWLYRAMIILFAAIFLGSAGYVAFYIVQSKQMAKEYAELQNLKEQNTDSTRPTDGSGTIPPGNYVDVTDPETGEAHRVLQEFGELYKKNSDLVGWIEIPGTDINYPVMQSPNSPDYYLKRDFNKKASSHGCIYVREACDVNAPSDNLTIYGHRMKDGSMFGQLENYMDKSFFPDHRYIYFDTLTEIHTYEIIAVFKTSATEGKGFPYHTFVDAENEEDFNEYVSTCKELSLYKIDATAQYGDKLITLSTCEYSQANGRLVIVAKRLF